MYNHPSAIAAKKFLHWLINKHSVFVSHQQNHALSELPILVVNVHACVYSKINGIKAQTLNLPQ